MPPAIACRISPAQGHVLHSGEVFGAISHHRISASCIARVGPEQTPVALRVPILWPDDFREGQRGYGPQDLNRSGHGQPPADHTAIRAVTVAVAVLRLQTAVY